MINYDIKYIKYKNKYLKLKGGTVTKISDASINNKIKEPIDLYYKKYMKYKTKYIESKRLVGGVETCPKIFGYSCNSKSPLNPFKSPPQNPTIPIFNNTSSGPGMGFSFSRSSVWPMAVKNNAFIIYIKNVVYYFRLALQTTLNF